MTMFNMLVKHTCSGKQAVQGNGTGETILQQLDEECGLEVVEVHGLGDVAVPFNALAQPLEAHRLGEDVPLTSLTAARMVYP